MQMFNPTEFNHDFPFSGPMSCACSVHCKIQSYTSHSQKSLLFCQWLLWEHAEQKINLFSLFYSPVRLSIKPVLSAHLLITGVVSPLKGPSTSIFSTRQTQSIIDFSNGFSSEYLLLLQLLKYSLVCVPTITDLFIYCSPSQPSYKLGKSNMKKKTLLPPESEMLAAKWQKEKLMFHMATWEYTELKLKKKTDFILRNIEKLHIDKEPCDGRSDHQAFPIKSKPAEGMSSLRTILRIVQALQLQDLEARTEQQRSSNIEGKTWAPSIK